MLTAKAILVVIVLNMQAGTATSYHYEQRDMQTCEASSHAFREAMADQPIVLDCVSLKGLGEGV